MKAEAVAIIAAVLLAPNLERVRDYQFDRAIDDALDDAERIVDAVEARQNGADLGMVVARKKASKEFTERF